MPSARSATNAQNFYLAFNRYMSSATFLRSRSSCHHVLHKSPYSPPIPHLRTPHLQLRHQTTTTSSPPHHSTQKPPTHYDLFPQTIAQGAPPSGPFSIDLQSLKREFLKLQGQAHPDRHSGADKSRAEGTSALINEAYRTLADPLLRAQYLLSLHGIDVAEDETAKIDDPELLGEVLEVREMIEGAENEGQIEVLRRENEEKLEDSVIVVGEKCERGEWEEAKSEAVKLRYWVNIREALRDWEPGKPVVLVH